MAEAIVAKEINDDPVAFIRRESRMQKQSLEIRRFGKEKSLV